MGFFSTEVRAVLAAAADGLRLIVLAPGVALIAGLPELAQHVVEIRLGMFASLATFRSLQMNTLRWQFGDAKIAGLYIAIFVAMLFWANRGAGRRWYSFAGWNGRQLAGALALNLAALALGVLVDRLPGHIGMAINLLYSIATLPLLVLLMGALLGDRSMTLPRAFVQGWGRALRMSLWLAIGFAPLLGLHFADHYLAFGKPLPLVWAVMVWDALVVATMACMMGTMLHHGYAGPRSRDAI